MTARLDTIELRRGDTWVLEIEWDDASDLTGWDWACQWRINADDETAVAAAVIDDTDADVGRLTLTVPWDDVDVDVAPTMTVVYDVQRTATTDPDDVETVCAGDIVIVWDVTR